jgi:hypothetical protein
MNKNRFTVSITAGITVALLLIGGTGTNTILFNTGYAQTVFVYLHFGLENS